MSYLLPNPVQWTSDKYIPRDDILLPNRCWIWSPDVSPRGLRIFLFSPFWLHYTLFASLRRSRDRNLPDLWNNDISVFKAWRIWWMRNWREYGTFPLVFIFDWTNHPFLQWLSGGWWWWWWWWWWFAYYHYTSVIIIVSGWGFPHARTRHSKVSTSRSPPESHHRKPQEGHWKPIVLGWTTLSSTVFRPGGASKCKCWWNIWNHPGVGKGKNG